MHWKPANAEHCKRLDQHEYCLVIFKLLLAACVCVRCIIFEGCLPACSLWCKVWPEAH